MQVIKLPSGVFSFDPEKPLGPPGGFGQVFLGADAAGAEVAVKRLHLTAADAAHRELDIARELKRGSFQHVLPVLDAGEDAETGGYFVVMPRAEFSLRQELNKRGRLPAVVVADIMRQVAAGLAEIPGVVHRDLKPDNILWHAGAWKIADFGIARFVEDATSARTLKGFLSPPYAAPEQWRGERATNATDVYALACIGYELLTGAPPFTTDPARQHQTEELSAFECSDSRLKGLVALMARKPAAARPSILRVHSVLATIVDTPPPVVGPLADLAAAGAAVAADNQRRDAAREAKAREKQEREQLHTEAQQMLRQNVGRLWEKIHAQTAAAERGAWRTQPFRAQIILGSAKLEFGRILPSSVASGQFAHSRWDVVSSSTMTVTGAGGYEWDVSLWYVKQSMASDFRWFEAGYFEPFSSRDAPFSANGYREADLAASRIIAGVAFAWGPVPIDGEDEAAFHERCVWLFARAAQNTLRHPASLPINVWPPQM